MDTVQLTVRPRFLSGTDIAKKIRRAGLIPAVVYGRDFESRAVAADPVVVTRALKGKFGRNQLFMLKISDSETEHLAIARDLDIHPVTRKLRHVDFFVIKPDTKFNIDLPLRLMGRSVGQKVGGRLNVMQRTVPVSCTPLTLPYAIEIDLTPFEGTEGMTVDEVTYPEGVEPMYRTRYRLFEISRPKLEEEEEEEETDEEGIEGEEDAEEAEKE